MTAIIPIHVGGPAAADRAALALARLGALLDEERDLLARLLALSERSEALAALRALEGLHVGEHPDAEADALAEAVPHLIAVHAALRAIPWRAPQPADPPAPALEAAVRWAAARVGEALAHARWARG